MYNPINITTTSGVRLDVYASETIEVNMGGISLLSLENRTVTYTNKFKMPRTPVNESVFGFASQPTRNNKPVVDVIITKGIFQKRAKLTVTDFETDYQCSISYDFEGVINAIKNQNADVYTPIATLEGFDTEAQAVAYVFDLTNNINYYTMLTNTAGITSLNNLSGTSMMKLTKWIEILGTTLSLTFTGSLLSDVDFVKTYICLPNYGYRLFDDGGVFSMEELKFYDRNILASTVLKAICQIFFSEMIIDGSTVTLKKIDLTVAGLPLEGFTHTKPLYTGLEKTLHILYKTDNADKSIGSDTITADGQGEKDLFTIESYIPESDTFGFITDVQEKMKNEFCIFTEGDTENTTGFIDDDIPTSTTVTATKAAVLTMDGVYSDTLDPILSEPVILKAQKYLTQLEFDTLTTDRVLVSVQLGGRYWVDSLAYNLTTGNAVMTLIKL